MRDTAKVLVSLAGLAPLIVLLLTLTFRSFSQIEKAAEARKHTFILLSRAAISCLP